MELKELYTSFLPKKVKNDARQYPAPSQIYLSSNMQKLKLLRMEKEKKKSIAQDMSMTTNNVTIGIQNTLDRKYEDIKRSKSFNQSPMKQTKYNEGLHARNLSIPFGQYITQQMNMKEQSLNDENSPMDNSSKIRFQNSLLSQMNMKEQDFSTLKSYQQKRNSDKSYTSRASALNSKNLYQKSMVILDQTNAMKNEHNTNSITSQHHSPLLQSEKEEAKNIDLSMRFAEENNLVRYSGDYCDYEKELEQYKLFQKKMKNQREKSPMNKYFQMYSQQEQKSNQYDKYFPHYQTRIEISSETNPEGKLKQVMAGKMTNYIPPELRNLDSQQQLLLVQRKLSQFKYTSNQNNDSKQAAHKFDNYNRTTENKSQYNPSQQEYDKEKIQFQINQIGYTSTINDGKQISQRRGNTSFPSARPPLTVYAPPVPASTKIIKPPLSINAHQNKNNIIVNQQYLHQTTVGGEKQTYIIPLQQNYSVCLNEIDRIKYRRKNLISKQDISLNTQLQSFNQENSKNRFLNRIEQSRHSPKNQIDEIGNYKLQNYLI